MEFKFVNKIGKKRVRFEKAINSKGKEYNKAVTKDTPYTTLEIKNCKSIQELADALPDIMSAKVAGFMDWGSISDHIAYGLARHVGVLLNMGQDVKLTENQRETLKMYVKLVELGKNIPNGMQREQAIQLLTMQGFENAEALFDSYAEPSEEEEDEDDASV